MKVIIIGIGSIGQTILRYLSAEGHTITVIDENRDLIENMIEEYDVSGVVGNGACMDIQAEAGAKDVDLVIALTRNDELNIFACMVSRRLGVAHTAARVRNPDYRKQIGDMKDALGISMVVNPELETAKEIFNLISLPSVSGIEYFAQGQALLVEVIAREGCMLIGESLASLGRKLKSRVLICAVQRRDDVIIPSGDFVIQCADRIHFTADVRALGSFLNEVKLVKSPLKNVMIVGGGKIGYYLADALSQKKYDVKLIEESPSKADELAEALPEVSVSCGNGTRHDLLTEEGIEAMDAFVALTDADEENMIVSMFANRKKVKKVITQIENDELFGMLDELGIENTVSPKQVVAGRIVSYVRALSNSIGSHVQTLYPLVGHQIEALEFTAKASEPFCGKPLSQLSVYRGCLVACIIRGSEVMIPNGNSVIMPGDNVVVVSTRKNIEDLSDIFE